jgi:biuret amidohydrolase
MGRAGIAPAIPGFNSLRSGSIAICGVAIEIGIEPTVRHGADLGYIPIVVTDACGAGNDEAGQRALANIEFMGDAFRTDAATFERLLA